MEILYFDLIGSVPVKAVIETSCTENGAAKIALKRVKLLARFKYYQHVKQANIELAADPVLFIGKPPTSCQSVPPSVEPSGARAQTSMIEEGNLEETTIVVPASIYCAQLENHSSFTRFM